MHPDNKGKRISIKKLKRKKKLKMSASEKDSKKFIEKFNIDDHIFPTEDDVYLKAPSDEDNF